MPFIKTTNEGLKKWRWQFAVRRLRAAYDAARSSLDDELLAIKKSHDKWYAEAPDPHDYDATESHHAWETNLIDRHEEANDALALVKQGFAVVLYHSWERHTAAWIGWGGKKYYAAAANKKLNEIGYTIDPGVHKLQKLVSCIKHDNGELWKQDKTMFEDVVAEHVKDGINPDYARNLKISDYHMSAFFDALMESGPPGKATPGL